MHHNIYFICKTSFYCLSSYSKKEITNTFLKILCMLFLSLCVTKKQSCKNSSIHIVNHWPLRLMSKPLKNVSPTLTQCKTYDLDQYVRETSSQLTSEHASWSLTEVFLLQHVAPIENTVLNVYLIYWLILWDFQTCFSRLMNIFS